jgi:hypothetical protein
MKTYEISFIIIDRASESSQQIEEIDVSQADQSDRFVRN